MTKALNIKEMNDKILSLKNQIEDLKKQAISKGYNVNNDTIFSNDDNLVVETFLRGETEYESYGYFQFKRKLTLISEKGKNKFFELINGDDRKTPSKQEIVDFLEGLDEYDKKDKNFCENIFDFGYGYIRTTDIFSIVVEPELEEGNFIMTIYIKSEYGKIEGYISFILMDFENYKNLKDKVEFEFKFNKINEMMLDI